ncbi:hypothetical protein CAPN002_06880 [Capnocytophaga stomatis]|uniref:AAA family ATPase n=1 Tax=Capnocytophaga stomatis TaxID=1848904 RepID=UPI00194E7EF7|nr:AAA family ATPase [Capnocytophaga stomatis]GIJ93470.1 hypothetical protein CAPN002_06880 [Capnocytophaga stomatis]
MAKIKLTEVKVNKYKSIQIEQNVKIEPHITTIVGMNESGKTNFLTAIAKTNYFNSNDKDFKFDITQDYPRSELIDFQNSENDCNVVECFYEIQQELLDKIQQELGIGVFLKNKFSYTYHYKDGKNSFIGLDADVKTYLRNVTDKYSLSETTKQVIISLNKLEDILNIEGNEKDDSLPLIQEEIKKIIEGGYDNWQNELVAYIAKIHIKPNIPKFWYFDDYYPLSGKININKLTSNPPTSEKEKTSLALFELARINPQDILNSSQNDYERFIAQLEASSNKVTNEIFRYWTSNNNLDIEFKIQEIINNDSGQKEKVLDIRVKSQRHKITLPLDRRSKGFNWFFSFIVWFSKIQADRNSDYILLLDEPGLNLHASAQADLLKFFNDLSKKYQIIYTTHSPFMVESEHLDRVRTCFEREEGTIISESIQEKDPNTLFPLQAALGYDIAQNLFISKHNLLVEGPADLIYLTLMSNILDTDKRTGLNENITIVPVGGLDKVSTFISLLRGSKLDIVCLLDTFTDKNGKQKLDNLIQHKIIKEKNVRFFNEFANNGKTIADIEDLFDKEDYLKVFNEAFKGEYSEITLENLDNSLPTIIKQINKFTGKDRFNHYKPANKLNQLGVDKNFFSSQTLDNFERMFIEINKLFSK